MQLDLFGKKRYQVNLHMHTTLSDGALPPEEAVRVYAKNGYDAVALTDHWKFGAERQLCGITVLPGCEYNLPVGDSAKGAFHIVGIGMKREPETDRDMSAQELIHAVRKAGGLAVLAHPAWSLNTPEQILPLEDIDATEIYNSVSGVHMSRRPDSGIIVDMLASQGRIYPLLASDDTHYYDGTDDCIAWSMVQAEECTADALIEAIKLGRFYSTQGPEIHLLRTENGFTVRCSPCREIVFLSNLVWTPRVFEGEALTEASYTPRPEERFLRAQVTDANGRMAWTNICLI